jgi:hypothetical protein
MEGKFFNAAESLKDWDPSIGTINKVYCGPGKQYVMGNEFKKLSIDLKNKFEKEVSFKIGDFVATKILVREADPETKGTKNREIGNAEIIDIILDSHNVLRLRLRFQACNNYKGNFWPHYSDVKVENCYNDTTIE